MSFIRRSILPSGLEFYLSVDVRANPYLHVENISFVLERTLNAWIILFCINRAFLRTSSGYVRLVLLIPFRERRRSTEEAVIEKKIRKVYCNRNRNVEKVPLLQRISNRLIPFSRTRDTCIFHPVSVHYTLARSAQFVRDTSTRLKCINIHGPATTDQTSMFPRVLSPPTSRDSFLSEMREQWRNEDLLVIVQFPMQRSFALRICPYNSAYRSASEGLREVNVSRERRPLF